jgi:hypothetical protein
MAAFLIENTSFLFSTTLTDPIYYYSPEMSIVTIYLSISIIISTRSDTDRPVVLLVALEV